MCIQLEIYENRNIDQQKRLEFRNIPMLDRKTDMNGVQKE